MRRLIYFIFASVAVLVFVQCSDWTEMENKFTEPVNINSEDYYRALREYKKTDHPICFGWYSDWSGTGDDMNNQLRGIPDSMDLVSLWGGAFNLTEAQKSDLKEVREKKGTRILYCQHIMDIGRSMTPASVENITLMKRLWQLTGDGMQPEIIQHTIITMVMAPQRVLRLLSVNMHRL